MHRSDGAAPVSIHDQLVARDSEFQAVSQLVFDKPTSTRVIALANQKGGVGKTTTAVNLAAACAVKGLNVLMIDMDSQGNASTALGVDHSIDVPSMYDVIVRGVDLADVIQRCPDIPSLLVAPSTIDLAGISVEIFDQPDRAHRLYRALDTYFASHPVPDFVFIDCPPSIDLPTLNALVAADEVLIPLQAEYYSLEGLQQLQFSLSHIRQSLNDQLDVAGILVTMFDKRNNLSLDVYGEVKRVFPDLLFETTIPRSVRAAEAPSNQQSVVTMAPSSLVAMSYVKAAHELICRGNDPHVDGLSFFGVAKEGA